MNSNRCDLDLSKGRASKALLDAAGTGIQAECKQKYPNGIQDGEIAVTSGGQLPCKAIYHGALPKYSGPGDEQVNQEISGGFRSFYSRQLVWMFNLKFKKIIFQYG